MCWRPCVSTPDVLALRRDTVLVVDDTPETLSLLTDTLDHAGFTVLIATDGEAALELLEQVTPDLVLMDAADAGHQRFRDLQASQARQAALAPAGDLHDRIERNRARSRGTGLRRRRLRDQADRARCAAGAHSRASGQRARGTRDACRTRCERAFPVRDQPRRTRP